MILIDEPDIRLTFGPVLEENEFRGVDVYKELLAIQNFKSPVYCVLITDVVMPKMDGFDFYKQIKKIDGRKNIVFGRASGVNYAVDEDKAARLPGSREEDEVRRHFIRKQAEINNQGVNKELKEECRINQQGRSLLMVPG